MADACVIVPAFDAEATLGRTLDALEPQLHECGAELVVIDNGSRDGTAALVERRGIRLVRRDGVGGPAAARNAGIDATTAPLIAFTDADCEPARGWLRAILDALADADLVTGPVAPDPRVTAGPFDKTLSFAAGSLLFETANLAVRRTLTDRVRFEPFIAAADDPRPGLRPGPDEGPFGEDTWFGWRAIRGGARVAFREDALVHHAVFPRSPGAFLAERRRSRYFPTLVRDVPELRTGLTARVFLSRRSALFDVALASVAVAAARRRVWPLLGALPYANAALWRRPLGPWLAQTNAVLVAGDALTCAALVRGSVAARRVVL